MTRDNKAWQKLEVDIGAEVQSDSTPFPKDDAPPELANVCRCLLDRFQLNNGMMPIDPIQQRGYAEMLRKALKRID